MTPQEITGLRMRYEALVRDRIRIEEQLVDVVDALGAEGLEP